MEVPRGRAMLSRVNDAPGSSDLGASLYDNGAEHRLRESPVHRRTADGLPRWWFGYPTGSTLLSALGWATADRLLQPAAFRTLVNSAERRRE